MKRKILALLIVIFSVTLAFGILSACTDDSTTNGQGAISKVVGGKIDGTEIFMFVDKDTDSVSLADKISCKRGYSWRLSRDELGQSEIITKIATGQNGKLKGGDNYFYIFIFDISDNIVATYTLNVHRSYQVTIKFYANSYLIGNEYVYTGELHEIKFTPAFVGYTFNGWKDDKGETVTKCTIFSSIYLYADITGNNCTYPLDANGGTIDSGITTVDITYGQEFTLPVPTRKGYTFNGWYFSNNALKLVTDANGKSVDSWNSGNWLNGNVPDAIIASWTMTYYNVELYSNGLHLGIVIYGTVPPAFRWSGNTLLNSYLSYTQVFDYFIGVTLKELPAGYEFDGWYINGEFASSEEEYTFRMPDHDIIITARIKEINK